jgi:hypothetical protein
MCKLCVFKREQKAQKEMQRRYYNLNKETILNYKKEYYLKKMKLKENEEIKKRGRPRTTGAGYKYYKENLKVKNNNEYDDNNEAEMILN